MADSVSTSGAPRAKDRLEELAIFGRAPAFERPLHVGAPNIGDRDRLMARLEGMLDRRWLSNDGPLVQELESRLRERLGVRHCLAVCNGTVGLEILVRALELEGEVIVPSFTFVATAHALRWLGVRPVFCDIDPATHNLDPERVAERVTRRTTGILGVHVWGRPAPVEALAAVADAHGLRLLFDAAHAFGASHAGRGIGGFGAAEVFSFHATKYFNAFEGGAIATDDDDLAKRIRLMRNFGFATYDTVVSLGVNGKMSEPAAAMALTSLDSLDAFVARNRAHYERYGDRLREVPGITLVPYAADERRNYQFVVLEVDAETAGLHRDELLQLLWAENVRARRYFHPGCHRMEPYRTEQPGAGAELPHTEAVAGRVLSLPTGTAVRERDVDAVAALIRLAVANAPAVRERLREAPPAIGHPVEIEYPAEGE